MSDSFARRFIKIGAAILLLALLASPYVWSTVSHYSQVVLSPVSSFFVAGGDWIKTFSQAQQLKKENESLLNQVAYWSALAQQSEQLNKENIELRNLTGLPKPKNWQTKAVEVVGRQNDDSGTVYLINAGSNAGLRSGLAVVASINNQAAVNGLLVGIVKSVGNDVSTFALVTNPSSRVVAQVLNSNSTQGLVSGEYNTALRLNYLPVDEAVALGEAVLTSNADPLIPPGLLLGTVTAIQEDGSNFFKSAIVTPPVRLDRFRFLYVLTDNS